MKRLLIISVVLIILYILIYIGKENFGEMEAHSTAQNVGFPAEWEPHKLTYMAWPSSAKHWDTNLAAVRRDIAGIARAIAKYEPLVMLTRPHQARKVRRLLPSPNIEILAMELDDLWARDTLPAFTHKGNSTLGVDLNFNGWGEKEEHRRDSLLASRILEVNKLSRVKTWLVGEGGALETDGAGTLLVTRSSLVNPNRNSGRGQAQIEAELKRVLGVEKVIWFEAVVGKDTTDAHVDGLVRFLRPGLVLLDRSPIGDLPDEWSRLSDQAMAVLKSETDARGNPFEVVEIHGADPYKSKIVGGDPEEFESTYVNFYVVNGAVIMPRFGDEPADRKAEGILREHFPGRDIVPVGVSALGTGGGGIHCATHEFPSL